ncbi:MAG: phosphoglucosamine mutase [Endomicrobiaceae bacterium]|jgi:phosphoglucosamine mutase|nr:phosphoglucosamine mutase [Endomicrobiaceae bacterium]
MEFFGTDGIRGKSNEFPFDNRTVSLIGYVLAKNTSGNGNGILIGRDTRESGVRIFKALRQGINAAGVKVVDLGVIPTAAVAYLLKHNSYHAGIVISASHNPYTDNGIKFFNTKGMKLADNVEAKLEKELTRYINEKKELAAAKKIKNISGKSLIKQYSNFLLSLLPANSLKNKKIVVDCANGASYKVAPEVLKKLKAEVVVINDKPTGKNINLNCGALHPEIVAEAVKKENAFCGFAFDGDADRVISVDHKGIVRDGDYFLAVTARHLKQTNKLKNNTLVVTVMANLGLIKAMKEAEINTVVSKVGDRYVYENLKKHKAVLGGEQSGHIIFKNLLDTGDGMISAVQLLKILVSSGSSLSELCSSVKKYPQILINEKVSKKIPVEQLPETLKLIKTAESDLGDNGRVLVRYSGTENLLRVMIEGQNKAEIKKMAQDIAESAKQEISRL